MVGAHQSIFDRHLTTGQVDKTSVDEVGADPARAAFVQVDGFDLDPGKPADARADRHASANTGVLVHVGEACVLQRLAGGVDRVDDEGIDLALDLRVYPFVRIEPVLMVLGLYLARDLGLGR